MLKTQAEVDQRRLSYGMAKCNGCGQWFKSERGLSIHQHKRYQAMGCKAADHISRRTA